MRSALQTTERNFDWRKELNLHMGVTPVQDRTYFNLIYFRESGGVFFEIATHGPGFLIDESAEASAKRCVSRPSSNRGARTLKHVFSR